MQTVHLSPEAVRLAMAHIRRAVDAHEVLMALGRLYIGLERTRLCWHGRAECREEDR